MKKLLFVVLLLILSCAYGQGQTSSYVLSLSSSIATTSVADNLIGNGATFHKIVWNIIGGTVSACQVQIDSSTDGTSWSSGGVLGTTACTTSGTAISSSVVANYVRINLTSFTSSGGTPQIVAVVFGYVNNPASGGTGTVTNVATTAPISGGPFTTTGNIACPTCAVQIAAGTSALGTGAISSATCATVVTTAATGAASTSRIVATFNADPTAVTGYIPSTSGMLTIIAYPTTNNVNFKVCNNTNASITPGAITLNWVVF